MVKKSLIRFWEIDFLRGIAVILMIFFHFLYDLNYFGIIALSLYKGYFLIYVYLVGIIFFTLVGISLTISYSKVKDKLTNNELKTKFVSRGLRIFGLGILISLISYIILNEGYILFGVLHCIGLSIILAYPFLKYRYFNLLFGLLLIVAGLFLKNLSFNFYWLFWIGFIPENFYTIDYYPILPWLGVILIGLFLGNMLYFENKRKFDLANLSNFRIVGLFTYLGKNSLIIYFIHQPILLFIIFLYSLI
jgi:uncharacterized membrane protein